MYNKKERNKQMYENRLSWISIPHCHRCPRDRADLVVFPQIYCMPFDRLASIGLGSEMERTV